MLITGCAVVAAALAAAPASDVDLARLSSPVLPLMLVPLIAALGVAGLLVAVRPAWARWWSAAATVLAVQVTGIAMVACRDWYSFAGADGTTPEQARAAVRLATGIGLAAVAAAVLSLLLLRDSADVRRLHRAHHSGQVWLGAIVAFGLPFVLVAWLESHTSGAVGQFALWWSLPWGTALAAAGLMPSWRERCGAWLSLLYSILLTLACVAAPLVDGATLRLPG